MIREPRISLPRQLLLLLLLVVSGQHALASTLQDALAGALARSQVETDITPGSASRWLSDTPSLTASYIDSQESRGTDEAELIFNLPIKSRGRRRLDKQLSSVATQFETDSNAYRRWVYSGYVRERAWATRLAQARLEAARDRLKMLGALAERSSLLAASGALPVYAGLIVERERLAAELELDARQADFERSRADFSALTGLPDIPRDLSEPTPAPTSLDYASHPALRRLERAREQEAALLALSAPDTASWNLAFVARDFDGPAFDEEQYGLQIEMPLNFLGTQTTANRSQRRSAQREYLLARDELWLELKKQWDMARVEANRLNHREGLLSRAVAVGERIEAHLLALRASTEIDGEILLQRLLDVTDTRSELAINAVLVGRNRARLRQAAGWTI
jgi:hypothetical protein